MALPVYHWWWFPSLPRARTVKTLHQCDMGALGSSSYCETTGETWAIRILEWFYAFHTFKVTFLCLHYSVAHWARHSSCREENYTGSAPQVELGRSQQLIWIQQFHLHSSHICIIQHWNCFKNVEMPEALKHKSVIPQSFTKGLPLTHGFTQQKALSSLTSVTSVTPAVQDGHTYCRRRACDCGDPHQDLFCCPGCDNRPSSQCLDQSGRTLYPSGASWLYGCQQCRCLVSSLGDTADALLLLMNLWAMEETVIHSDQGNESIVGVKADVQILFNHN